MSNIDLPMEVIRLCKDTSRKFSDLLIQEGERIAVKYPRGWEMVSDFTVTRDHIADYMKPMRNFTYSRDLGEHTKTANDDDWKTALFNSSRGLNTCFNLNDFRMRSNVYTFGDNRIGIAVRKHPKHPPLIQDTGLPANVFYLLQNRGVLLVSGPTGSGKTTTMAAFVETINATRAAHVVTIEDPIEYLFERKKCIFSQREVPTHIRSFHDGLMDAVRQKPDVIYIGELRDRESVDTAFRAGESGALVMASLHANSSVGALNKLLSFYDPSERKQQAELMSSVLIGVISQALLPNVAGTDYKLAYEVLHNKDAIQPLVRNLQFEQINQLIGADKYGGTMNMVLSAMIKRGDIALEDALEATEDRSGLDKMSR